MLLSDSRRPARTDAAGDLVLLEDQDRSLWDWSQIAEGVALIDAAMLRRRPGPYQVQAAISALHSGAAHASNTDWPQIASLYGALYAKQPSPVVALNRAVAIAMAGSLAEGLARLAEPEIEARLASFHPYHAARADLLRRAGSFTDAAAAYREAIRLCGNAVEARFLRRRLADLPVST
jgi:RNA polymerase sigma-70 factor (ECF subfamily)